MAAQAVAMADCLTWLLVTSFHSPPPLNLDSPPQTFENAIRALDDAGDESYGDATMVLQLLRDNMTLWMTDLEERGEVAL